ncbi:hypothetical protein ACLOJK_004996 [Asimina triloba]
MPRLSQFSKEPYFPYGNEPYLPLSFKGHGFSYVNFAMFKADYLAIFYQVLVRFPNGERKERRFHSTATIQSLYDYVDSLDCLQAEKYSLVSNFPRVIYGVDKHSLSLKEAGLHPQASLLKRVPVNPVKRQARFRVRSKLSYAVLMPDEQDTHKGALCFAKPGAFD